MAFRRLGPLLFLLVVFSPLRAAAAEGDQAPTAVLGIEPLDGVPDALAHASIRFGLGRFTTEEEIDYAAHATVAAVTRLRAEAALNR